jgi:hypothetical protein
MTFTHLDVEAVFDDRLEVDAAPAHDFVLVDVGAFGNQGIEFLKLRFAQLRWPSRPRLVAQAIEALRIIAMHPVAQGLTLHPAGARRLVPRSSVNHHRDRQQPARLPCVLASPRLPAQIRRRKLIPLNRQYHPAPSSESAA